MATWLRYHGTGTKAASPTVTASKTTSTTKSRADYLKEAEGLMGGAPKYNGTGSTKSAIAAFNKMKRDIANQLATGKRDINQQASQDVGRLARMMAARGTGIGSTSEANYANFDATVNGKVDDLIRAAAAAQQNAADTRDSRLAQIQDASTTNDAQRQRDILNLALQLQGVDTTAASEALKQQQLKTAADAEAAQMEMAKRVKAFEIYSAWDKNPATAAQIADYIRAYGVDPATIPSIAQGLGLSNVNPALPGAQTTGPVSYDQYKAGMGSVISQNPNPQQGGLRFNGQNFGNALLNFLSWGRY